MISSYKFMPPPSKELLTTNRTSFIVSQPKQENQLFLSDTDEDLLNLIKKIDDFTANSDLQSFLQCIELLCRYLEGKILFNNLQPLFQNISHTTCAIIESLEVYPNNISQVDCIFHFFYILTSPNNQHLYFELLPIDILIHKTFLYDNPSIYFSCVWFFELISNFASCPQFSAEFDPNVYLSMFYNVGSLKLADKIIHPLRLVVVLTENPIDYGFIAKVMEMLNVAGITADRKNIKCPIIQLIAKILYNLCRNQNLNIGLFLRFNFHTFVRQHFSEYIEFVKFFGYLSFHYGSFDNSQISLENHENSEIFSVSLTMLAAEVEEIDFSKNGDIIEYYIWAMYNTIIRNCSEIVDEEIVIAPLILVLMEKNIGRVNFSVKKNSILLVSLIYSLIPVSLFNDNEFDEKRTNYYTLLSFLDHFRLFLEDFEEEEGFLLDNIVKAMVNIHRYLSSCLANDANEPLIGAFEELKDLMITFNFAQTPNISRLLSSLTFLFD